MMQNAAQQAVQQADTAAQTADSVQGSLTELTGRVTDTGRLILEGRWDAVWTRVVEGGTDLVAAFVPNLLAALFVAFVFFGVYWVLAGVTKRTLNRSSRVDEGLETMAMKTLRVLGLGFIGVLVLAQLGVNVSALVAGLGIAGLAVGFAAKDSLENFISGITILMDRPFFVGNWITVGDIYGRVTSISLRSTRIVTLNQETVIFPNVEMVNQGVVNHTMGGALRVDVPFGIAYKEDVEEAREVVMGIVDESDDRLEEEGGHRVVVTGLQDSSVGMELHLYILNAGDAVPVRFEYTEKIRKALGEAGIEIPFPHLQLFVDGARALEETPIRIAAEAGEKRAGGEPASDDGDDEGSAGEASSG